MPITGRRLHPRSPWRMSYMHAHGGMPIPAFNHTTSRMVRSRAGDLYTRGISALRVRKSLKAKILELGATMVAALYRRAYSKVPGGVIISAKHILLA